MIIPLLISTFLSQSPALPPDTAALQHPKSGSGILMGTALSLVDQENFRIGLGPVAGLYFFQDLSPRVRVQIEFQGKLISGYKLSTRFEDNVLNPNGLSVSSAEFDLRSLLFFEIPVVLSIRPTPASKHSFFAGIRPSMNVITGKQSGGVSTLVTNGEMPEDLSRLSLREAVSPFDLGISAGWNFAFNRRLSLDIRYTQGMVDLTADTFFKNKSNTLNSDLQLSLRANF